jgi:hypothetical protein
MRFIIFNIRGMRRHLIVYCLHAWSALFVVDCIYVFQSLGGGGGGGVGTYLQNPRHLGFKLHTPFEQHFDRSRGFRFPDGMDRTIPRAA